MNLDELIKRAEEALKELPPTPWRKEYSKGAWCIVDSNNQSVVYDIDDTPEEIADFIEHSPVLIRGLVDALKNAWDFIATDDVSDEATIVAELGERRKEKCGITFLDGDTYVVYAGDLLEVYAKSAAYDEIGADEKR